jgi:hypothetical protein
MQFREQLSAETFIDLAKLQDMSRYGIPDGVRGEGIRLKGGLFANTRTVSVWPYLLGVLKPLNSMRHSFCEQARLFMFDLAQQDTRRLSSYQVYLNMEQDKQSTADISKRVRYSVERCEHCCSSRSCAQVRLFASVGIVQARRTPGCSARRLARRSRMCRLPL